MAIEKMVLLKIVGSLEEMHAILQKLVLCENVHLSMESNNAYNNNYIIHQYESVMTGTSIPKSEDYDKLEAHFVKLGQNIEKLCNSVDIELKIDKSNVIGTNYDIKDASEDLEKIQTAMGQRAEAIGFKKSQIYQLEQFKQKIKCINDKNMEFGQIADLNFFDYEIGALSHENKVRIKKNYENISAIVLRLGILKSSVEDMYIIIYPKKFKEETSNLLKSLNWSQLIIPEGISGTSMQMIEQTESRIETLQQDIAELSKVIEMDKEENKYLLNKIYTTVKLEQTIVKLEKEVDYGENIFALNAWVRARDKVVVEEAIGSVTNKFIITEKKAEEIKKIVKPPTELRNNKFVKPFELIVRLYGLPSYYEIDPTPFLAVTFCLMFGIMFGDIGQGLVYFLAGVLLSKKMEAPGAILKRLGASSILFGFVYGSLFGLEQAELPWLPSLIGRPLDPKNIPLILIAGVVFGVIVLTISFLFGIVNALRRGDVEDGIFGKNGVFGYIFFISLVTAGVTLTGVIPISVKVPVTTLLISLIVMILKQPITNLVTKKRPLINHGSMGSYFTESIFEGVETVLNALSNAISFIRVGAFALNHAGLFLAFLVMSEMTNNILLKIIILILGNVLILTLEGLVVFIQGLRLQYYEMFSKYFNGDGIEYKPVKIDK